MAGEFFSPVKGMFPAFYSFETTPVAESGRVSGTAVMGIPMLELQGNACVAREVKDLADQVRVLRPVALAEEVSIIARST